jgi:predicted DNA-binding protein with PD1-like motif
MQYAEGRPGRVFVMRVDNGEELLAAVRQFLVDKDVRSGTILFLGALMDGKLVTGPEEPVIPPVPMFIVVEGGWEIIGIGTIYPGENGPSLHYHVSVGRAGHALTGCLREFANVYLVVEVIIIEFTGLPVVRRLDPGTGLHLPVFPGEKPETPVETAVHATGEKPGAVRSDGISGRHNYPGGPPPGSLVPE